MSEESKPKFSMSYPERIRSIGSAWRRRIKELDAQLANSVPLEEHAQQVEEAFNEGRDAFGLYSWQESYAKHYLDERMNRDSSRDSVS